MFFAFVAFFVVFLFCFVMIEGRVGTRALEGDRRWVVEACSWRTVGRRGGPGSERTRTDVAVRLDERRGCVLVDPSYRDDISDPIEFDVGLFLSLSLSHMSFCADLTWGVLTDDR